LGFVTKSDSIRQKMADQGAVHKLKALTTELATRICHQMCVRNRVPDHWETVPSTGERQMLWKKLLRKLFNCNNHLPDKCGLGALSFRKDIQTSGNVDSSSERSEKNKLLPG